MKFIKASFVGLFLMFTQCQLQASEASFCLSDDELKLVLVASFWWNTKAAVSTCTQKFPEISAEASQTENEFSGKYSAAFAANGNIVRQIFLKRGLGAEQAKIIYDNWSAEGNRAANASDLRGCKKLLEGLRAASAADTFHVVEDVSFKKFAVHRSAIRQCGAEQLH